MVAVRTPPPQVASIACGQYHTAACTTDGELFTWGANTDGQLGMGDDTARGFPHLVAMAGSFLKNSGVVQVTGSPG